MPIPPEHLPRITLHGIERMPVKRLSGYRKHHTIPQRADDYHNGWIARIADTELQTHLNETTKLLRQVLNYKRKDFSAQLDGNTATVNTATFTYTLSVELDPESPAHVQWQRQITEIIKTEVITDALFSTQIGDHYQQTRFHTDTPIVIESLIDTFEEKDIEVDYPHDCATCTIQLPEIQGHVLVHPNGFTIEYPAPQAPHTLLNDLESILPLPADQFINLLLDNS